MENDIQRTPEIMAIILRRIFYCRFNYELATGYRIEWPEFRTLAGLANITAEYLAEINEFLNTRNLILTSHLDFLAVDKLDRLEDLRTLTSNVIRMNLPGRVYLTLEHSEQFEDIHSDSYLKCGDGFYRSWDEVICTQ